MEEEHYRFINGAIWQHVDSHWGINQVLRVLRERMPDTPLKEVFIRHLFSPCNNYDVWLISNREINQQEFYEVYEYFIVHKIDCFRSW